MEGYNAITIEKVANCGHATSQLVAVNAAVSYSVDFFASFPRTYYLVGMTAAPRVHII